jgi:hypothetical protein
MQVAIAAWRSKRIQRRRERIWQRRMYDLFDPYLTPIDAFFVILLV